MIRNIFLLLAFAGVMACQNKKAGSSNTPQQPDQTSQTTTDQLPADFLEFYEKFHTDSLYQIAHISWPLQGDDSFRVDSTRMVKRATSWEPKDWTMHRKVDFSTGEFQQVWEMLGDELIIERISYKAANYGLERRFVKQFNDEWELIFYSDMQEISR